MGINFDAIMSNGKGATNIAKIKVTVLAKTEELKKAYTELGKAFYQFNKKQQSLKIESPMAVGDINDELVLYCLTKVKDLEQEISDLETQVSNEKGNMKSISTLNPIQPDSDAVSSSESGVKCPRCGLVQSPDNSFCVNCGNKMSE